MKSSMSSDKRSLKKPKIAAFFKTNDESYSINILESPTFSSNTIVTPKQNRKTIRSLVNKAKSKKEANLASKKLSDSSKRTGSLCSQASQNILLTPSNKKSNQHTTYPDVLDRKNMLESQIKQEERKYKELEKKYKSLLVKYMKSEEEYKQQINEICEENQIHENPGGYRDSEDFKYHIKVLSDHVGHLKEISSISELAAKEILFNCNQK